MAGGIIDEGEAPPDAARRELREETGFEAEALLDLGWVHPNPALQDNRAFLFLAPRARRVGSPSDAPDEQITLRFVDPEAIDALSEGGGITHALALLTLERARRALGRLPRELGR